MGTPLGNGTNPKSQVLAGWEVYGTDVQNHPLGLPETCAAVCSVLLESQPAPRTRKLKLIDTNVATNLKVSKKGYGGGLERGEIV